MTDHNDSVPSTDTAQATAEDGRVGQKLMSRLLDRLYNALSSGPTLNCRPHSSRQRLDLRDLAALQDKAPEQILRELLGPGKKTAVEAKAEVPPPPVVSAAPVPGQATLECGGQDGRECVPLVATVTSERPEVSGNPAAVVSVTSESTPPEVPEEPVESEEVRKIRRDFDDQIRILKKLRAIAEDARDYLQDTGVHALYLGYPLLSLPPSESSRLGGSRSGRILAPLAFVPVHLLVQTGRRMGLELSCSERGADRVVPNQALFAWIERQSGKRVEIDDDPSAPTSSRLRSWASTRCPTRPSCSTCGTWRPVTSPPAPSRAF